MKKRLRQLNVIAAVVGKFIWLVTQPFNKKKMSIGLKEYFLLKNKIMKQLHYFLLIFLLNPLFISCKKDNSTINDCLSLELNANWASENFKRSYSIQFPSDYEGNGMVGFEGNVFSKSRKDKKIKFQYAFCSPLFCNDFGKELVNSNDSSISITDTNGQQLTLNKKINLCENDKVVGVYYYIDRPNALGKLFWKQENSFREALTVEYEVAFQNEVEQILKTIKSK